MLQIKKLNERAVIPKRGSSKSAGYDLYATEQYTLKPLERKLFKTGLAMSIPSGMYGRIAPRSGLAFKQGIDVMAGVIDEDYRDDVGVILINLSDKDVSIPVIKDGKETAIAQIIFEHYYSVDVTEVSELDTTDRGGGFGSTDGKHPAETHSSLIEKYKEKNLDVNLVGTAKYEKIVRDREKSIV